MLKKIAILFFACLCFGVNTDELIKQNSTGYELGTAVKSVYASSPTLLYMLYALSPNSISGINFEFNDYEKPYLKDFVLNQPIVGGFFGKGKMPNMEMLLRLSPDLILANQNSKSNLKMKDFFKVIKKPILYLSSTSLDDYVVGFEILGKVLDKKERADELIAYAKESLGLKDKISKYLSENNISKVSIYYAQGSDGLQTECEGSLHASLIEYSGAINVHKCDNISQYGRVSISFEQVLKYQPDIILVYDREFFKDIFKNKKWSLLKAIKDKKVYLIPYEPFNWFDRPPSFMRFLGIKWLVNLIYPNAFNFDIKDETRRFYKMFLDISLDDDMLSRILNEKQ